MRRRKSVSKKGRRAAPKKSLARKRGRSKAAKYSSMKKKVK